MANKEKLDNVMSIKSSIDFKLSNYWDGRYTIIPQLVGELHIADYAHAIECECKECKSK